MYFSISQGSLKAYLQWFPYTKISDDDKELIKSREFFDKYIDSGGFVLFPEVMRHSENFIQKGDGSFRNSALISPLLFLVLQSIGKEISCKYIPERPNDIEVFYAGNYNQSRAKYGHDYDNFYKAINAYAQECRLCQEKFAISGLRNMNQEAFCSNAWTDVGFKYARETDQSSAYSMRYVVTSRR